MEILVIQSSQDLTANSPSLRAPGAHSYRVNCRQFSSVRQDWQRHAARSGDPLALMTLGFERIFLTEAESREIAEAIASTRSPVQLD